MQTTEINTDELKQEKEFDKEYRMEIRMDRELAEADIEQDPVEP